MNQTAQVTQNLYQNFSTYEERLFDSRPMFPAPSAVICPCQVVLAISFSKTTETH